MNGTRVQEERGGRGGNALVVHLVAYAHSVLKKLVQCDMSLQVCLTMQWSPVSYEKRSCMKVHRGHVEGLGSRTPRLVVKIF